MEKSLVPEGQAIDSNFSEASSFVLVNAREISRLHQETTRNILEIGRRLLEVKPLLGHGVFGAWIRTECGFSERTANRYMNAAKAFRNSDTVSEISISVMHALSSPKLDDVSRREILESAKDTKNLTVANVKAALTTAGSVSTPETEVEPLVVSGLESGDAKKILGDTGQLEHACDPAAPPTQVEQASASDSNFVEAQVELAHFLAKNVTAPPWKLLKMVRRAGLMEFAAVMVSALGPMERPEPIRRPEEPGFDFSDYS